MVYRQFLAGVLKIDARIRYVGVFADAVLYDIKREGLKPLLDNKETEKSLQDAVKRFRQRKLLAPKIGNVIYAFAKYEKINRIAMSIFSKSQDQILHILL